MEKGLEIHKARRRAARRRQLHEDGRSDQGVRCSKRRRRIQVSQLAPPNGLETPPGFYPVAHVGALLVVRHTLIVRPATPAAIGLLLPDVGARLELLITPVLAVLLYGMFAQIPFFHLREAFSNRRFMVALLISNFVLVPVLAWALAQWLPDDPAATWSALISTTPAPRFR